MRIYEIAKDLGISSKDVISFLNGCGVECSSHMTVLSDEALKKVREKFSTSSKGSMSTSQVQEKAHKKVIFDEPLKATSIVKEVQKANEPAVLQKKPVDSVLKSVAEEIQKPVESRPIPKKSDYVAEPVILEEDAVLSEDILSQTRISRFIGKAFDSDKVRSFRSGARRRRRQRQQTAQVVQEPKIVTEIKIDKEKPLFEVADMMGKSSGELILALFKKGMICNRNHLLSLDNIRILCELFNINFIVDKEQKTQSAVRSRIITETMASQVRWPVVVVMGHVDHGKTTLLDYIRKMNVAASEKGGITQHLAAYEVDSKHGKIVFIDTPGHEAFYQMRERGAKITDLVILVIAVDDGIKPQTVEAINHAKSAGVPIIVAVNKIDKMSSPAALETIKRQLAQHELMPEDWGGNVVIVPISAKTGQGVEELLEMVVLQSQIMDLKADANVPAKAFVLESKIEKGLGPVATVICSEGTIKQGDFFTCGSTSTGRIRLLINSLGKKVAQVGPSIPVQIAGFDTYASSGDWLDIVPQSIYLKAKQEKSEIIQKNELTAPQSLSSKLGQKNDQKVLNLVIKSDTRGSIDAIIGCIQKLAKLSKEVNCPIRVVYSSVGDISESDVELAENTGSLIIGFYVKPEKNAALLARDKNVEVKIFHVIYHLVEDLEKMLESKRKIEAVWKQCGEATVKKVFDIKGIGIIAGCYMRDGVITKGNKVTCMRAGKEVGAGKVNSLQRDKKTVKEVHSGYECGFTCEGFTEWQEGDTVICFAEVKQTPNPK
ncbi:MAG: Translation initiation factor IF-2 [candidate division TM6 bacterium GW2011_GWF2_37_49]|nr:MAG: Translation initiation factor IF-2 [candidate division TM6 bacterium GW2011_GWF2_37_49]